jgi:hypothetical protein
MAVRTGSRVEIRLDEADREKLARVVEARGGTVSEVVRSLIHEASYQLRTAELECILAELQRTATWAPTDEEIRTLTDELSPDLQRFVR